MTQEGTNTYALNGDINYDITNNLDIIASKDTYSYTEKTSTKHAGISVGTKIDSNMALNGITSALDLGGGNISNKVRSTTYNNVDIIANNINIKTGNNTDIKGANITAKDSIDMDIGNNLNIESLQDTYYATSKNNSWSASASFNTKGRGDGPKYSGGIGGGGTSINSITDSQWVNEQTSIIGNNSVNIKVGTKGNNEGNTNIVGAVIASGSYNNESGNFEDNGNLSLTTNSLTYQDLNDYYTSITKGSGLTTNVGTSSESFFKGIAPNGTTTITLVNSGEDKKQDTRATIGNGNITIGNNTQSSDSELLAGLNRDMAKSQETTQDQITGALNGEMKIDNRIFTPDGLVSIYSDAKNLAGNTKEAVIGASKEADRIIEGTYKISEKVGEAVGGDTGKTIFSNVLKYTIGSTIGGAISAFGEDGRTKDNYVVNNKVYDTWDEAIKDNPNIDTYNMGGVGTDLVGALKVSNDHPDSINRVNASDGLIGDTIEAGISALLGLTSFTSDFSALGRMQADDLRNVRDTENKITNYNTHSEGTIAFSNGLQVYINRHGETDKLKGINYNALGYATYKEPAQDNFNKIKDTTYQPADGGEYRINFDKMPGDPVSGLASPTLKDNLFTIMYNTFKGNVSITDHFEDNAYYDKYFGKTNLVNRQLINQSRGITNSFENINNQRTQYVMPYENQNNKK